MLHYEKLSFTKITNSIVMVWNCAVRSGQLAYPMPIGRVRTRKRSETHPIFRARTFCLVKKKKPLDLQFFSRIGKTMKKLQ